MANKTIVQLPEITDITQHAVFPVDTGTETFKISAGDLSRFVQEFILPAGLLTPYGGTAAPTGWLLADGSAVSRSTYARLFTAIGTAFGTGDGSTTFNVPDMRGRVPAGKDDMGGTAANRITNAVSGFVGTTIGANGGSQTYTPAGTLSGSKSIAHTHNIAHAHQVAHTIDGNPDRLLAESILNDATTTFTGTGPSRASMAVAIAVQSGSGALAYAFDGSFSWYTTGVLSPPGGAAGSTAASGAMSANATVSGSDFTFNGTATHRVQPTIITNYLIKT